MHYNLGEYIVESELAAKPISQTNSVILKLINELPNEVCVLDYGCGKLRYSIPLASRASKVIAIDSAFQVDKKQQIGSCYTSPKEYHIDNLFVYDLEDTAWKNYIYDVVLCTNVLSAIPLNEYRLHILQNAYEVLSDEGFLIISIQYRNSYFSAYKSRKDVIRYNDGWLIKRSGNKYAFYGMPSAKTVSDLCYKVGFQHCEVKSQDGTYFIKAIKGNSAV